MSLQPKSTVKEYCFRQKVNNVTYWKSVNQSTARFVTVSAPIKILQWWGFKALSKCPRGEITTFLLLCYIPPIIKLT